MLPRTHILFGAIFTLVIYFIYPGINLLYLSLLWLSSFLIDFDHYIVAANKTRSLSLFKALHYFKVYCEKEKKDIAKGIKKKGHFMIFHTFEFHILVLLLAFLWQGFFFVFLGMVFHSILDIVYMVYYSEMHRREFWFVNWILDKRLHKK